MIQFYRDSPDESIPYAVVTDLAAVRKVIEKSDVLIYTASCSDWIAKTDGRKQTIDLDPIRSRSGSNQ